MELGDNFSLPTTDKKSVIFKYIKNIENNLSKLKVEQHLNIRNLSIPIMNTIFSLPQQRNGVADRLRCLLKHTKKFTQDNPEIIFTKADKGNIIVALNRDMYKLKMSQMLEDRDTYTIKKDLTNALSRVRYVIC